MGRIQKSFTKTRNSKRTPVVGGIRTSLFLGSAGDSFKSAEKRHRIEERFNVGRKAEYRSGTKFGNKIKVETLIFGYK